MDMTGTTEVTTPGELESSQTSSASVAPRGTQAMALDPGGLPMRTGQPRGRPALRLLLHLVLNSSCVPHARSVHNASSFGQRSGPKLDDA